MHTHNATQLPPKLTFCPPSRTLTPNLNLNLGWKEPVPCRRRWPRSRPEAWTRPPTRTRSFACPSSRWARTNRGGTHLNGPGTRASGARARASARAEATEREREPEQERVERARQRDRRGHRARARARTRARVGRERGGARATARAQRPPSESERENKSEWSESES